MFTRITFYRLKKPLSKEKSYVSEHTDNPGMRLGTLTDLSSCSLESRLTGSGRGLGKSLALTATTLAIAPKQGFYKITGI